MLVPNDSDLCRMARTCRYFAQVIIPPNSGVWRARFLDKYDHPPPDKSSEEVRIEYKVRSIILAQTPSFQTEEGMKEKLWLSVLTTLLVESPYTWPHQQVHDKCVSRNHARIKGAIMSSGILNHPIIGDRLSRSYLAIQLAATYLALDLRLSFRSLRTDYDLRIVYACDSSITAPPITASDDGESIDLYQVLHIRNFWKRHLTNPDEDTFYRTYHNLPEILRPKTWEEGLGNRESLACIHPLPTTFEDLQERQTCADLASHWDSTCALLLEISTTTTNVWFPIFNEAYPINPYIESPSRTYFRGTQSLDGHHHHYHANGNTNVNNNNDDDENPRSHPIRGFTETCPAQAGIPGWRRICFIIYEINPEFFVSAVDGNGNGNGFTSGNEGESEEEEWLPWSWTTVDFLWAFGYEGVILPGGGIMMGRWRNMMAEAEVEEGPFIFWTV
ncbi:conserved hypothetical protein [Histoplasma capsulatum G186AR]|uniref:F-box domain-containing protein n=1 Tax=Ajellomyces capsulatus (strain G186AR / H82 / ATCC MYA-2454 / RMSCC 2432) TaxID=447093 RepID=C0NIG4_AJECG|nr:uncharacterized protein HCBG_02221 [Histoplasma capsulatum G186AR]EEH08684.1 conserved hypothetical protein [Histoplasma capsulatum G186AR]